MIFIDFDNGDVKLIDYKPNLTDFKAYREGILSVDPFTLTTDTLFGGYVKRAYGGFKIAPDALGKANFPPKRVWDCHIQYMEEDKVEISEAKTIFQGKIYLKNVCSEYIEFSLMSDDSALMVLDEAPEYDAQAMRLCEGQFHWELSEEGEAEYYLCVKEGNNTSPFDIINEPSDILENFSNILILGVVGSLNSGEWGIKTEENGGKTVYVRMSDDSDPNTLKTFYQRISGVSDYKWTESTVTGRYYLTKSDDTDPKLPFPDYLYDEMYSLAYQNVGDISALNTSEFAIGDIDSLGFDTIYVRTYGNGDPDITPNNQLYLAVNDCLKAIFNYKSVPIPKAFGVVENVKPLRLQDRNHRPTYHCGYLDTTYSPCVIQEIMANPAMPTETMLIVESSYDGGSLCRFYEWPNVRIEGTKNYNGIWRSTTPSRPPGSNAFTIPKPYFPDYDPARGIAYRIADTAFEFGFPFRVFDDGVPILENVIINDDGTFSLTANPVGEVTISGVSTLGRTLPEVFEWACGSNWLNLTLDLSNAEDMTQIALNLWIDANKPVVDFLSDLSSSALHCFYIKADSLYVLSMLRDNGIVQLSESKDILDKTEAGYEIPSLVSQVKAKFNQNYMTSEEIYRFGKEVEISNIFYKAEALQDALSGALDIANRKIFTAVIPMDYEDIINIGSRVSYLDTRYPVDTTIAFRVRSLKYLYSDYEIEISGEKATEETIDAEFGFPDASGNSLIREA